MIAVSLLSFLFFTQQPADTTLTRVNSEIEIEIFNYQFTEALETLKINRTIISPYRYATYKSVIYFYTYYSDQPSRRNMAFVDSMSSCLGVTFKDEKAILASKNSDDILMLGGAYGFRGMAKFIKKERVSALLDADEAKDVLEDLIEADPTATDAYFGIGIYNYALSKPPAFLKVFLFMLGFSGDYDTGIEQLNIVASKGSHTKAQSILYLINHALYEDDHYKSVYPVFESLPMHLLNTPMTLYKKLQFEFHLEKYSEVHRLYEQLKPLQMPIYIRNYSRYVKAQTFIKTVKPDSVIIYINEIKHSNDPFQSGLKYDLWLLEGDYFVMKQNYDKAYELYRRVLVNTSVDDRFDRAEEKIIALSNIANKEYSIDKD